MALLRLATDRMLRRALAEERLRVEYQPIIDLSTGRATSAEALVRIMDPGVGLLQPDSFLEVAGTGFSSLAYLRQFPLDFVKIDRSFLGGATGAAGNDAIVAAIVGLSHALGLAVVAEGVQTERQLQSLVSLECDRAQGFLFARPGPPEAVDELVRSGPAVLG